MVTRKTLTLVFQVRILAPEPKLSIWQRRKGPPENALYRPRRLQDSSYYHCVEDHFETFERVYKERFERAYGFYRSYLRSVIYRYLDCGVLRNGFARVRCGECGHEYLLAFVLKRSENPALAGQASSLLPLLSSKASCRVWRMGLWGGLKKGSPPPLCLQSSQDPSTLFPL